jgi:hypothetical protein
MDSTAANDALTRVIAHQAEAALTPNERSVSC